MATKISQQLHGGLIQYIMVDLTDGLERWRSMLADLCPAFEAATASGFPKVVSEEICHTYRYLHQII
jgi:hypothetical protein